MNLIILHGNGIVSLSQKLSQIKKDFDPQSIQILSGKDLEFEKAVIWLSTPQLFSEKRLIVLEDFETVDLEKLPEEEGLTIVLKIPKSLAVNSVILKSAIKLKGQIFQFNEKDEKIIFPFLDNLAEKNLKALGEVDKLISEYGGQYILTMLFYLFRRLILKPKKLPDFVLKKIERQQRNFDTEQIKYFYKQSLETDFKIKSGLVQEKLGITLLVNNILTS